MGLPRSSTATSGTFRYIPRPKYWFVPGVTAQPEYILVPGSTPAIDAKDALMNDPEALRAMCAEFEDEDRALAEMGMAEYCAELKRIDEE